MNEGLIPVKYAKMSVRNALAFFLFLLPSVTDYQK